MERKEKIRQIIKDWHKDLFVPGSGNCCISSPNGRKDIQLIDTWLFKRAVENLIFKLNKI